jgi:lycopene beta-cyclase
VKTDLLLVGGGLANCLIAHRLLNSDPERDLLVVEREPTLGGNHTWSFHDSDLSVEQRRLIEPLVVQSWPRHELRFPKRRRVMDGGYNSVSSDRLHEIVARELADRAVLGAGVVEVRSNGITLADGETIEAGAVVDGRGDPGARHLELGYQNFVGLFVRLESSHGLAGPILMDATVRQIDGYRFVYTLPFSDRDLLIEDTYYADDPTLDRDRILDRIRRYALDQGWTIAEEIGTESGILPIVLGGDLDALLDDGPADVARSGMRGALFHPTTGYSLAEALRLADLIAAAGPVDGPTLARMTRDHSRRLWRRMAYFRFLNRMLFRAADPELRYRIFERFYGLSEHLIRRFYAGRLKWTDKVRLLIGKPPVPIHRAIGCVTE